MPEDRIAHSLAPHEMPLEIVYETAAMLVVNKARGIATHPAPSLKEPSLVNALLARYAALSGVAGRIRPGIVHRLDKDTTGLIMVAKTDSAHRNLAKQIEHRTASRRYVAWVAGLIEREEFLIDAPIGRDPKNRTRMAVVQGGKDAITHCTVLGKSGTNTVVEAKLQTGRTHQIRVHLSAVGHAVIGDPIYGLPDEHPLQLHAYRLGFDDPTTGNRVELESPPPSNFLPLPTKLLVT
jgi:23S rRNA pseudouridine1911/1915/1917 synthase